MVHTYPVTSYFVLEKKTVLILNLNVFRRVGLQGSPRLVVFVERFAPGYLGIDSAFSCCPAAPSWIDQEPTRESAPGNRPNLPAVEVVVVVVAGS